MEKESNIAVYTALFDNYDTVQPALFPGDFILFTDQDVAPRGWSVKRIDAPSPDPRYASRYFFDQSALNLPEYDITIMHGANAQLTEKPATLAAMLPKNKDIAAFRHPHRRTVEQEAQACKAYRKDGADVIDGQMARYRVAGFRDDVGLTACILLIRRNTQRLREFEAAWWEEVNAGSCRDQLSFDFVRWKLDMPVHYLSGNPFQRGDIFRVGRHK